MRGVGKSTLLWCALGAGVIALFLSLSLSARRHGVEVCLSWNGRRSCGRAWASSAKEAQRAAADNACGTITRGLAQRIACSLSRPESVTELR